jgi:hypothetical protein
MGERSRPRDQPLAPQLRLRIVGASHGRTARFDEALEKLEALYFFTQGLEGEAGGHLEMVRAIYGLLLKQGYPKFLADIRRDAALVREHYGALASDEFFRGLLREARAAHGKGFVYISKLRIVRDTLSQYENSVVRWPYVKLHSFVIYDPRIGFLNQLCAPSSAPPPRISADRSPAAQR